MKRYQSVPLHLSLIPENFRRHAKDMGTPLTSEITDVDILNVWAYFQTLGSIVDGDGNVTEVTNDNMDDLVIASLLDGNRGEDQ